MRDAGFGADVFTARHANFAQLSEVLAAEGVAGADRVLIDLGVSSMQLDCADRGFNYKRPGPLDLRMDPSVGEPASHLVARLSEDELAALLVEHADEPQAAFVARLLKQQPVDTIHAFERIVRTGLHASRPDLSKSAVKMSVRRTQQALRIAVNDEMASLEALLRALPGCLAHGGRVAVLTFHSGEDRRVKKAFAEGHRAGVYAAISRRVIRSGMEETRADRRAQAAKLRWAVRERNEEPAASCRRLLPAPVRGGFQLRKLFDQRARRLWLPLPEPPDFAPPDLELEPPDFGALDFGAACGARGDDGRLGAACGARGDDGRLGAACGVERSGCVRFGACLADVPPEGASRGRLGPVIRS